MLNFSICNKKNPLGRVYEENKGDPEKQKSQSEFKLPIGSWFSVDLKPYQDEYQD